MNKVKNVPLYVLAKEEIRQFIQASKLKDGDKLPSEGELCSRLGISRGSLREATRALEEEDVLIRKQGLGTFISHTLINSSLDINEGVTEMIKGKGMIPGSRNASVDEIKADGNLAKKLNLSPGDPVVAVKRLRTANEIPVAYTEDFLPRKMISDQILLRIGEFSLYDLLETNLGIELSSSLLKLRPMKASKRVAEILGIRSGDMLMFLQQTDTDAQREPVLYSEEYFISKRFEFVVMRKRKSTAKRIYAI